ncbi:MAG: hypothetical protein JW888_02210 [Pirellulales bacterium]|nr:hypothetical protein [Pirellulales bacterium]
MRACSRLIAIGLVLLGVGIVWIFGEWIPLISIGVLLVGSSVVRRVVPWIARPLDLAAKDRQHPTQFTIVDFLCLFVLVQAPTALIHAIKNEPGVQIEAIYLLDGFAWISVGLIWWKCVEIMSRAGIQKPRHRVVLLLFVLPVTVAGPLVPIVFPIVVAIGMVRFYSPIGLVFTALCIAGGLPAALFWCARLTEKVVAASEAAAAVAGRDS